MAKKMSLQPPTRTPEDFIRDANRHDEPAPQAEVSEPSTQLLPWNEPGVRQDVIKSVNLRLDEPTLLKLKWVSEKTRISQQELIRLALVPYLDEEIARLE
jgi:hypothetical protein